GAVLVHEKVGSNAAGERSHGARGRTGVGPMQDDRARAIHRPTLQRGDRPEGEAGDLHVSVGADVDREYQALSLDVFNEARDRAAHHRKPAHGPSSASSSESDWAYSDLSKWVRPASSVTPGSIRPSLQTMR